MSELIYCPECGHPKWDKDHSNCTYESLVGEKVDIQQSICPCAEWTGWIGARPPVNFNVNYGHHPNCDGYGNRVPLPPESAKDEQVANAGYESLCPDCHDWPSTGDAAEEYKGRVGHHINCPSYGQHCVAVGVDEPELQLLVLDMGDCCVVRVEKGSVRGMTVLTDMGLLNAGDVRITGMNRTFTELREAIDGEKPANRIEQFGDQPYFQLFTKLPLGKATTLTKIEYDALSELAGKPLPLYEGGKWDELIALQSKNEYGNWIDKRDFTAWRFTR